MGQSILPVDDTGGMWEEIISAYAEATIDTDRDRALQIARAAQEQGASPEDVVLKLVVPALDRITAAFSRDGGTNVAQFFMTAQIADAVTSEMVGHFSAAPRTTGCVVIGNACGDVHALGRKIVVGCLRARMITVYDLGANVRAEAFVDAALANDAQVIGISSMMVHTARGAHGCLRVRSILHERGLEHKIKLIVGGAAYRFDPELYKTVGADTWAENALTAGQVIERLFREVRR